MAKWKQFIRPSKIEWTDYSCNIYRGCSFDCKYCYAKLMNRRFKWVENWRKPIWDEGIIELAKKEVKKLEPGHLMVCSCCDPYQPIEKQLQLTRRVLPILLGSDFHILILTKSDLVTRDYDILVGHGNVSVGFTITSLSHQPDWEPYAPSPRRRINALKRAYYAELRTYVSIEPWIPVVTNPIEIIEELHPWVDFWILGPLNYQPVPCSYYAIELPRVINVLEKLGANYRIKRDLQELAAEDVHI